MKRLLPHRGGYIGLSLVIVLIAVLLPFASVYGAEPDAGHLDRAHPSVSWTGGPFYASNPTQDNRCAGADRATCDLFVLTVEAPQGWLVTVATETVDDIDLVVYDRRGDFVAGSGGADGNELLAFRHDRRRAPYEVRVQPFLVTPGTTYNGDARLDPPGMADVGGEDCLEPVPQAAPESVVADDGRRLRLDVLVLLDGMKLRAAQRIFKLAGHAYDPLGIDLSLVFEKVSFAGKDLGALLAESVAWSGGERPAGVDLVHTFTSKDVGGGVAMCIGGVRYDGAAFSVSQGNYPEDAPIGPFMTYVDTPAVIVAHEIGHLLGAHHHYGNCLEGLAAQDAEGAEVTACTVMNDLVIFNSLKFDSLSAAIVRDHVLRFANN